MTKEFAMPRLLLASTSPYRREQLERLGITFEQRASGVDEDQWKQIVTAPAELALALAQAKAEAVARELRAEGRTDHTLIIAGDQVAAIDDECLDKPGTEAKAVAQLQRLAGKTHYLHSAVAVHDTKTHTTHSELVTHAMTMRPLSTEQIQRYISRERPLDCVGSYKIESQGIALFASIEGRDHSAIVGLPLMLLTAIVERCGARVL